MTDDEPLGGRSIEGPKSDPLEPLPEQGVDLERIRSWYGWGSVPRIGPAGIHATVTERTSRENRHRVAGVTTVPQARPSCPPLMTVLPGGAAHDR